MRARLEDRRRNLLERAAFRVQHPRPKAPGIRGHQGSAGTPRPRPTSSQRCLRCLVRGPNKEAPAPIGRRAPSVSRAWSPSALSGGYSSTLRQSCPKALAAQDKLRVAMSVEISRGLDADGAFGGLELGRDVRASCGSARALLRPRLGLSWVGGGGVPALVGRLRRRDLLAPRRPPFPPFAQRSGARHPPGPASQLQSLGHQQSFFHDMLWITGHSLWTVAGSGTHRRRYACFTVRVRCT